jgi:hypothetical protein
LDAAATFALSVCMRRNAGTNASCPRAPSIQRRVSTMAAASTTHD